MRKHPIQKFIGLTVLYAVLIVGIFVLQFKTESVLTRSMGHIRVTLAQTQTEADGMQLKDQFQVSFGGLTFSGSGGEPVMRLDPYRQAVPLSLASWREDGRSVTLGFGDGSELQFSEIGTDGNQLLVSARAAGEGSLSVPYRVSSPLSVQEEAPGRLMLAKGNAPFTLSAAGFADGRMLLGADAAASYAPHVPEARFEFSAVAGLPQTDAESYATNIKQFRSAIVTRFAQGQRQAVDSLTEGQVVAYVAEMASQGRYSQVVDAVSSFRRNSRRTYLSVPYLGNLVAMDRTLSLELEKDDSMVLGAVVARNLDIFTVSDIADFILREKKKPIVASLMAFPAQQEDFAPTPTQAAGIISVYAQVRREDAATAAPLQPVVDACAAVLAHNADIEDGRLVIREDGEPLPAEQRIRTGAALVALGTLTSRDDLTAAGRLLVNQELADTSALDLQALCDLYPLLVPENRYYPHQEILGYYGTSAVWAWTCAPTVAYQVQQDGSITIASDFLQGNVHHTIFKNVPPFHAAGEHTTGVVIRGMNYRSAADFEDYRAFGYIYQADTRTLFLKSVHNERTETITLYCDRDASYSPQ